MKVTIDRDECIGCATCWEVCPDVFEEGPDEYLSQVVEKYRVHDDPGQGEIPEELEECVREAADGRPVQIIHTEE